MSVATHLGLPDDIMEEARTLLEPRHMLFEDWMKELQAEREELKERLEEADRARASAEAARLEVEAARSEVEARLAELDRRREEALREIDRELSEEFDSVRKRIRQAEASLSWQVSDETIRRAASEVAEAKQVVQESLPDLQRRQPAPAPVRIRAGDVVEVKGLNVQGTVVTAPEGDEEAEVAIGGVRFKLDPQRLTPVQEEEQEPAPPSGVAYALGPMLSTTELHVRGMRVDEALFRVDEFLDRAVRDGMSSVRIVHGQGYRGAEAGRPRAAVRPPAGAVTRAGGARARRRRRDDRKPAVRALIALAAAALLTAAACLADSGQAASRAAPSTGATATAEPPPTVGPTAAPLATPSAVPTAAATPTSAPPPSPTALPTPTVTPTPEPAARVGSDAHGKPRTDPIAHGSADRDGDAHGYPPADRYADDYADRLSPRRLPPRPSRRTRRPRSSTAPPSRSSSR